MATTFSGLNIVGLFVIEEEIRNIMPDVIQNAIDGFQFQIGHR